MSPTTRIHLTAIAWALVGINVFVLCLFWALEGTI